MLIPVEYLDVEENEFQFRKEHPHFLQLEEPAGLESYLNAFRSEQPRQTRGKLWEQGWFPAAQCHPTTRLLEERKLRPELGNDLFGGPLEAEARHCARRTGLHTGEAFPADLPIPVPGSGNRVLRASFHAPFTSYAKVWLESDLGVSRPGLHILAPNAAQWAALEKDQTPYARAIVNAEVLCREDDRVRRVHGPSVR